MGRTQNLGAVMLSGADGSYWADKVLPCAPRHDLFRRYLPQFGGMTGMPAHDRHAVYLGSPAGEGQHANGRSASADRMYAHMRMP